MSFPSTEVLNQVYGESAAAAKVRLEELRSRYEELFGAADLAYFTAPGRTEIIGNHTDHNGGKILAASITMDTICAAAPNGTSMVNIASEGYPMVSLDISKLGEVPHCQGTPSLLAGMIESTIERGYAVNGFNATVSSEVIPAAGVSSSASFEMLVCAIINGLFNDNAIDVATFALIGQYAENVWWEKASGLLDQMACAVGGTILLDFSHGVNFERVDFAYDELGCELVLVNTGKGHADLSAEYSAVPDEMHAVAKALGVSNLCESSEQELLEKLDEVRASVGSDRAIMRALHFFEECARVDEAAKALAAGDRARMLTLIDESGSSSWRWLQNAYVADVASEQPIPLALALTELYLKKIGGGACRLHGGGFAGVIMCAVPKESAASYVELMSRTFGESNVYLTNIRATGACQLAC
jgi:galactokinase